LLIFKIGRSIYEALDSTCTPDMTLTQDTLKQKKKKKFLRDTLLY